MADHDEHDWSDDVCCLFPFMKRMWTRNREEYYQMVRDGGEISLLETTHIHIPHSTLGQQEWVGSTVVTVVVPPSPAGSSTALNDIQSFGVQLQQQILVQQVITDLAHKAFDK